MVAFRIADQWKEALFLFLFLLVVLHLSLDTIVEQRDEVSSVVGVSFERFCKLVDAPGLHLFQVLEGSGVWVAPGRHERLVETVQAMTAVNLGLEPRFHLGRAEKMPSKDLNSRKWYRLTTWTEQPVQTYTTDMQMVNKRRRHAAWNQNWNQNSTVYRSNWCQESIATIARICFTYKCRTASRPPGLDLNFDNFETRPKRRIFKWISSLNGSSSWGDDRIWRKRE